MKLIFLFVFCLYVNAKECFEKDQAISYFYINGVGVSNIDAKKSIKVIQKSFDLDQYKSVVKLLYNPTDYQGTCLFCKNKMESMVKDLTEVISEKSNEYEKIVKNKKINEFLNQSIDRSLITLLNTKLTKNKPNIIIAHSQGNLIANQLCHLNQNKIGIISIATPAGELPCNQLNVYVLYQEDKIIKKLREIMPNNKYIIPNFNIKQFLNFDFSNHLLTTYLYDSRVLEFLSTKFSELKDSLYNDHYNFDFLTMEIVLKEKIKINQETKDNIKKREEKANAQMADFFNYKSQIIKDKSDNGLIKQFFIALELIIVMADKPFPVKNDQELADFLLAIVKAQYNHCLSLKTKKKKLSKYITKTIKR